MKILRKILLCTAVFAAILCLFCACKKEPDGGVSTGGGNNDIANNTDKGSAGVTPPPEGYVPNGDGIIFSPDVDVSVIKGVGVESAEVKPITEKIYLLTNRFAVLKTDDNMVDSKEIVIGESTRSITKAAKNAYAREYNKTLEDYKNKGFETRFLCGYIVYSDGNAVTVYWDDEISKPFALEYFVNKFLQNPLLCLGKGFCEVQYVDKLALMKDEEEAKRKEEYAKISATYGAEVEAAVRAHLAMFDERFYLWLADLYDPGEYDAYGNPMGGGFYYSNSARDNTGFGIDIESTAQALSFLTSSGLLNSSTEIGNKFPEKMQREMAAFAFSCQSPVDGYFYHPQWGTNVQVSRISRDLGNAVWILKMMGEIPYWDTPSNVKGSLGAPGAVPSASSLTAPLTVGSVAAVSKVILAEETVEWTGSAHLATVDAWDAYLTDLTENIRTKSYSIGNTVSSQSSQIVARDAIAISNGELPDDDNNGIADGRYIETFERIFNALQLPNGLWEECSVEDGTVYYDAINGIMKISSAYNGIGVKMNYIGEGLRAAAFMVTHIGESDDGSDWADSKGKIPDGSVDVYNPWVTINALLKNAVNFYTKEESDALRENIIKPHALEMIKVTTRKIEKFAKADGSYGYTWTSSPSNSQGAPVSVPGTVEGDINGGCIAFTGTYNNMANALGFGGLKPFGPSDFYAFIDRASAKTHAKKDASASFDGDVIYEAPSEATFSGAKGSAIVVDDPRDNALGNVVSFDTIAKAGCSLNLTKPDNNPAKSGACLEWEMAFTDVTVGSTTAFQIKLGKSYMFVIGVDTKGKLTVSDSSSTNGSIALTNKVNAEFNAYDWNSFKIEYYVLNATNKTTAAKIYVNGELVCISDTYVSKESDVTPSLSYSSVSFYALNAVDFTVQFDNIKAYDLVKKYQAETPEYTN